MALHSLLQGYLFYSCTSETVSSIHYIFSLALQPPWALASSFSFMIILQTVGLLGRVISSSQGRYLNTGQQKHRINTNTHQTSMPCVVFEPTIPASRRAKAIYALDDSVTVTGLNPLHPLLMYSNCGQKYPMKSKCTTRWVKTLRSDIQIGSIYRSC
jgi:hypothetical protein